MKTIKVTPLYGEIIEMFDRIPGDPAYQKIKIDTFDACVYIPYRIKREKVIKVGAFISLNGKAVIDKTREGLRRYNQVCVPKGKMKNSSPTSESTELPIEDVNTTSVISMKELPVLDKRNVKLSPTLFNVFVDGGSRKKDGRSAKRGEKYTTDNAVCASGVVWVTEGKIVRAKGYKLKDHATNNCAELAAFYLALQPLLNNHKDSSITIHTDSVYCTKMLAKALVNSECGKGKANRPLVNLCRQVLRQFTDVRIVKVKAHSGIQLNEMADSLCTAAMGS